MSNLRRARSVVLVAACLVLAVITAACGGQQPAPAATSQPPQAAAPAPAQPAAQPPAAPAAPPAAAPAKPVAKDKVIFGTIGTVCAGGIYAAIEKGFFATQNIDLQFEYFDSGAKVVPALSTGQVEISSGTMSAGLFNAIDRGAGIKVVGDFCSNPPGSGTISVVVRKDLVDQIKSPADLKGRPIARVAAGTAVDIYIDKLLKSVGGSIKDVEFKDMPYPSMPAALANKAVDAAVIPSPMSFAAELQGMGVIWKHVGEFYPGHVVSALMFSDKFIKERPDVGRRFAVAYVQGVRYYLDAIAGKSSLDEIAGWFTKYNKLEPNLLKAALTAPPATHPDGKISPEIVAADAKFYHDQGLATKLIPVEQVVDPSFMDYAVKQLGSRR